MQQLSERLARLVFNALRNAPQPTTPLQTPAQQAQFTLGPVNDDDSVTILPQNVRIPIQSFIATFHYLLTHNHIVENACEIGSSNEREKAGPLCRAARDVNHNTRCITYILPILQAQGYVGINPNKKSTVWLL